MTLRQATSPHSLSCQQVVPAEDGGVFAVYLCAEDLTPTYRYCDAHIEAKRLGADVGVLWTTWASQNLKTTPRSPVAAPDGSGGAVVAWAEGPLDLPASPSDPFSDSTTGFEIFAQRFNAGIRWGTDGRVNNLDVA